MFLWGPALSFDSEREAQTLEPWRIFLKDQNQAMKYDDDEVQNSRNEMDEPLGNWRLYFGNQGIKKKVGTKKPRWHCVVVEHFTVCGWVMMCLCGSKQTEPFSSWTQLAFFPAFVKSGWLCDWSIAMAKRSELFFFLERGWGRSGRPATYQVPSTVRSWTWLLLAKWPSDWVHISRRIL